VLIEDTLAFLLGEWKLARTLDDHRSGALGTFSGVAMVSGDGAAAGYVEEGEIHWGAHAGPAFRRLELERTAAGSVLMRFSDGRPYVELDLRSGSWRAVHDCGADRYEIETVVRDGGMLEERWRVVGPAKDYSAVTTLTRA
jgi:hypothetical protein